MMSRTVLLVLGLLACLDVLAASRAPEMRVVGSTERLPLALTRVDATVSGTTADVVLSQTYSNRGSETIEALYVFPLSQSAAVYALSLRVGDRIVRAELQTRQQATRTYETAREAGQTATLLEQRDSDMLSLAIANILPGDDIEVELRYSELLLPEGGRYRFRFANTFGDQRYGGEAREPTPMPLSSSDDVVDFALDVRVRIDTPLAMTVVESPSHRVEIDRPSPFSAIVQLSDEDRRALARDFVVEFSMAGDSVQTGVLTHEQDGEGWFLLLAEPPAVVSRDAVIAREYLFLLDVSGSMSGMPIETAKTLMRELVDNLRPHERFNVLLFESRVQALTMGQSLPPGGDNLQRAFDAIDNNFGHGGTRLHQALTAAYALPRTPGFSRTLVVVTDGHIQAGTDVAQLINSKLGEANVFAMGIGAGQSNAIIEQIARAGRGEAFVVTGPNDAAEQAEKLRSIIDRPLLTDIRLEFDGIEVLDLEPEWVPDVFAQRPIVVTGRYRGAARGSVTVHGVNADGAYQQTLAFGDARTSRQQPAIRRLWARERLSSWMDGRIDGRAPHQVEGRVDQVTAHALQYGLLSPWTSFVAVHEEIRAEGTPERVVQPAARRDVQPVARVGGVGFTPPAPQLMPRPSSAPRPTSSPAPSSHVPRLTSSPGPSSHVPRLTSSPAPSMSLPQSILEPQGSRSPLRVGEHTLQLRDGTWTSVDYVPGDELLRIRRGSEAAARLLALRPELAPLFALSQPVILVINGRAVKIDESGFSDYPDEVFEALAKKP